MALCCIRIGYPVTNPQSQHNEGLSLLHRVQCGSSWEAALMYTSPTRGDSGIQALSILDPSLHGLQVCWVKGEGVHDISHSDVHGQVWNYIISTLASLTRN